MRLRVTVFPLFLAAAMLAACGGEDSAEDTAADPVGQDADAPQPVAEVAIQPAAGQPAPQPAEAAGEPRTVVIEAHELAATFISVLVAEDLLADPLDLEAIGRSYCEGRTGCRAVIWFDRRYLPLALPVDARQTEAAIFAYGINIAGRETAEWNCTRFPELRAAGRRCLPTTERML
jgi:hypothetical protein